MQKELEAMRDERVEYTTEEERGLKMYHTASHGFLAVPVGSLYYNIAYKVQQTDGYGYLGRLGVYLEEDCQAPEFYSRLPQGEAIIAII